MGATVVSLQLHREHGARPTPVRSVVGRVGGGLEGDSHVAKAARSVLVVDRSALDDLGLAPGDLREQITIDGIRDVTGLPPGTRVRLGGITLEVSGPCAPCTHIGELLDVDDPEAFRLSLEGRRGAACMVVEAAGLGHVGDAVEVVSTVSVH